MRLLINVMLSAFICISSMNCKEELVDIKIPPCNLTGETLNTVSDRVGIVKLHQESAKYYISYTPSNSYDTEIIGVVCNLPEELKKADTKIKFSGNYKKGDTGIKPAIGGQEFYFLELTKFSIQPND